MSMMSSNPSPSSSILAGQGRKCEQFMGDGQKDTFDLCEVPSSIPAMMAFVTRPLHPMRIPLAIGELRLDAFVGGYDALVDRGGKRIYLKQVLPKFGLLFVMYPFVDSNQSPAVSATSNSQTEPRNIPGWEAWDYQNWRDFATAMREGKPIEYAMCVWLMQQESNEMAFQDDEWLEWYHYARKQCPRFDWEQPRWR